jgi:hypothetical protein
LAQLITVHCPPKAVPCPSVTKHCYVNKLFANNLLIVTNCSKLEKSQDSCNRELNYLSNILNAFNLYDIVCFLSYAHHICFSVHIVIRILFYACPSKHSILWISFYACHSRQHNKFLMFLAFYSMHSSQWCKILFLLLSCIFCPWGNIQCIPMHFCSLYTNNVFIMHTSMKHIIPCTLILFHTSWNSLTRTQQCRT